MAMPPTAHHFKAVHTEKLFADTGGWSLFQATWATHKQVYRDSPFTPRRGEGEYLHFIAYRKQQKKPCSAARLLPAFHYYYYGIMIFNVSSP